MNDLWNAVYWAAQQVWNLLPGWIRNAIDFISRIAGEVGTALINFFRDPIGSIMGGLQWLQRELGNAIANVSKALSDIATWVWNALPAPIRGALEWLGNITMSFINGLVAFIKDPIGTLQNAWNWIVNSVSWFIEQVMGAIYQVALWVWNALPDWIQNGLLFIRDLAVGAGTAVVQFFRDPVGSIQAGLTWVANNVIDMVQRGISGLSAFLGEVLAKIWEALREALTGFFDWLLKGLSWIAEMVVGAVNIAIDRVSGFVTNIIGGFVNTITGSFAAKSPPADIARSAEVMAEQMWQSQVSSIDSMYHSVPTPEDLQREGMVILGRLITGGIITLAVAAAADIAHPFKDIKFHASAREIIYWAGIPSVTASIAVLPTAIGLLEPLRYALYARWQPRIPDAPDLVRFAVREVFIAEERQRLVTPSPGDEFYFWMAHQGYNRAWSDSFWASHWLRPTIQNLNEALYRDIINDEQWMREVRLNDYVPYAIPWLQQIIYSPYTRVDIRRMWDIGLVTEQEVYTNYKWLGYDDIHAKRMTLWTKAYVVAADIRAMYSKGWIDENGARILLIDAGVPRDRVDVFIKKIVKFEQPERMADEKDLTKTDILRMLKAGILNQSQAMGMLQDLGYDQFEAGYMVQLYTMQTEVELKELTQSQILKSYTYQIYTREQALAELVEAGWSLEAAEMLLKLEDVKRVDAQTERMRERDLTPSQIINAMKREIIDRDTGYKYLGYLGFSDWEINVYFALEEIA